MFYADYNATAPIPPGVLEKMKPYLAEEFGNPSSSYPLGQNAKAAIEQARSSVAALVGASAEEIVFVSGGTESCFHALLGAALANPDKNHFLSSTTEHSAVLQTLRFLSQSPFNARISQVAVNTDGALDFSQVPAKVNAQTNLLSFALANNETGVISPIEEFATFARSKGILLHTDAVQAIGKIPVNFQQLGVDLLSISGHKFGAPKGVGALVIVRDCSWKPVMVGGGQEQGRRGGTVAVSQVVGLGEAARLALLQLNKFQALRAARDAFEARFRGKVPEIKINGSSTVRLPNTSSITIPTIAASTLVTSLGNRGIMISSGSACHATHPEPSHVLLAMGRSSLDALSTIRISFGPETKGEEATLLAEIIAEEVELLRKNTSKFLQERMGE